MSRILDYVDSTPWAIVPEGLHVVRAIAAREELRTHDLQAIGRDPGRPLNENRRIRIRADGIAVLPVTGPLSRYANILTMISGATSFETLSADLGQALSDPKVRAIILDVDSPGGEVSGAEEVSKLIRAARGEKEIVALVSGMGASAAYWIASAASRLYTAETGILGSVGTVIRVDTRTRDGEIVFRSSQSPRKAIDPTTDEGAEDIQALLDSLAQVMIEQIAGNLEISPDKVLSDFGQGGVLVGAEAVAAGMAPAGIATLEDLITDLSSRAPARLSRVAASAGGRFSPSPEGNMPENQPSAENERPQITQADLDRARAEGRAEGEGAVTAAVAAERERIMGVFALGFDASGVRATARGHAELVIEGMRTAGRTAAEAALAILNARDAKETGAAAQRLAQLQQDEQQLDAPTPGAHDGLGGEGASAEVGRLRNARALSGKRAQAAAPTN